ncbi:Disintegrin and metalloproteinase domain-containing protein 10 [Mactra antiquata]
MKLFYVLALFINRICTIRTDDYEQHDPHLLYYEPIYYDTDTLYQQHQRSYETDNTVSINFHAFNRKFTLSLKRSNDPYKTILSQKRDGLAPDLSFIYSGTDKEYPGSNVRISIINGTFRGSIKHSGEIIYHVVPSHQFFTGSPPFHTVIYKESHYNWTHTFPLDSFDFEHSRDQASQFEDQKAFVEEQERLRRAVPGQDNGPLKKKICPAKITTHVSIWNYFMERCKKNEEFAYMEITNMLYEIISGSNDIFESTTFDVNGYNIDGIRIALVQIVICDERFCQDSDYMDPCCIDENLDYKAMLEVFDYYEDLPAVDIDNNLGYTHDDDNTDTLCLSMLVTAKVAYKDKNIRPIIGYTNHAMAPEYDSGICSDRNTGYITILRDDTTKAMPGHVLQILFAHEVAHAFGAYHDNSTECGIFKVANEPTDGYYLMNSVIQTGSKPNNKKMSECSRHHISKTLQLPKIQGCFKESQVSVCGNGILEPGEECDCGVRCEIDTCCHSSNATQDNRCKLKQGAQCSQSQGPCCNISTCEPITSRENFIFDTLTKTTGEMYGAVCPEPEPHQIRPDGFICNENGRVCERGSCNASVCKLIGWTECAATIEHEKLSIDDREHLCYMACKKPGKEECVNTNDEDRLHEYPELKALLYNISLDQRRKHLSIKLPTGTLCNNNQGYCDVFRRCRGADPDSPLVKLKRCLTGECLAEIQEFVTKYWWLVALCSVMAIVIFFAAVKCLAVHTKSNNPDYEEKHPHTTLRQTSVTLREDVSRLRNSMRDSFRRRSRGISHDMTDSQRVGVSDVEMALIIEGKPDEVLET